MSSPSLPRVLIIFLISFFSLSMLAQSEEQYAQIIKEAKHLEQKKQFKEALALLAKNLENAPPEQQSKLYFKTGDLLFKAHQTDSAFKAYNRAYELAQVSGNKELQSRILINAGAVYSQTGKHLEAIQKFNKAISVLKELQNDTLLASIQFNLALSYKELGANDKAISLALEASEKFKTLQIKDLQAKCYQTIGNINREIQKDSLSLYFHKKALSYYEVQKDSIAMASVLNDMGNTYKQLKDYQEALKYYQRSMELGDSAFNPMTLGNIAEVYQKMKDYGKAEEYYLQSIKLRKADGDLKAFAYSSAALGGLYVELEKYGKAKEYLKEAAKIAERQEYLDIQLSAFEYQWQLYEKQGNIDTAYLFLKGFSELKDQYYQRERQEIIEQKTAELGLSELQTTVKELTLENELKELLAQKERKAKSTYLLIAILITIIAVILANSLRKNRKYARWEKAQKMEVQHRTKNFLQTLVNFIQFQLRTTDDENAKAAIQESQSRVHAMLKIHKLLENTDSGSVNFNTPLQELVERIQLTFRENTPEVKITWQLTKVELSADDATLLALIVNELLTNAFKYGLRDQPHPKMAIRMKYQGEVLSLSIADNGPGIKQDLKSEETKGLKLVGLFVQQLNGSFTLENKKGTVATIQVKIKPAA